MDLARSAAAAWVLAVTASGCVFPLADATTKGRTSPLVQDVFFGETPQPTGARNLQLTGRGSYSSASDANLTEVQARAEFGVTDRLDVRASVPYRFLEPEAPIPNRNGFGNVLVGVLYGFYDPEGWTLAGTFDVGLGNAERGLGSQEVEYRPSFLGSYRMENTEVLFGFGGVFTDPVNAGVYYAAVVRGIEKWRGILELSGVSAEGENVLLRLTPGLAWNESGYYEISFGVPIGLTDEALDWGMILQASLIF